MAAPTQDIGRPDLSWGTWGQGLLTEWFETAADLIWPQSVVTYGRMRHDPQIKAVLGAYCLPILRATWALDPDGCRAEVVQRCSDDLGMGILGQDKGPGAARSRGVIWHRHLREALGYLAFGHMPFERRYEPQADGYMRLIHLGARMPWTIAQMHIDSTGTLDYIEQTTQRDPIPGNRLVWYVNEQEGSNWAGISMLRPAFGAWLLKHEAWRTHSTSIRRFGMGVPTVTAPAGATAAQVQQAQQLASSMRVGDSSGMGLPTGFTSALMGLTGSVPDTLSFIKYLDQSMAKMALTGLIELGQTDVGSRALGETFMDLYQLALQSVADEIATTATSGHDGMPGIVTDLVTQNWGEDEPAPRIVCTDVGENYEITAEAIGALVRFGALVPDSTLDAWVRKTWRLPKRPLDANGDTLNPTPVRGRPDTTPIAPGETAPEAVPAKPGPTTDTNPPVKAAANLFGEKLPTRKQAAYLEASQWRPADHQAAWEQALANLLIQYRAVFSAQRTNLVDQVLTALEAGNIKGLVLATPSAADGAGLVTAAMKNLALKAAQALIGEADAQGVHIDIEHVRVDAEEISGVAAARTHIAASYVAQQATAKAIQVYGPTPEGYLAAADQVDGFLGSLSETSLRDQLGAALTAAQNAGRIAVLEAAPESAGEATYTAAEFLDKNTCEHCRVMDGYEFGSLAEAEAAYPTGGYRECEGLMRCRGTVVARWGVGAAKPGDAGPKVPTPPQIGGLTAKFDPLELRDSHGRWEGGGDIDTLERSVDEVRRNKSGRKAAQTPSQFTHPDTGHLMGKTEIGDTFEALFAAQGAHLLSRFGGPYTVISGEGGPRNTPLDFQLDHTHAGELKTLNSRAANQKTAIKAAEVARKTEAAKAGKMKPLLVVQVIDPASGRAEVYAYPAFASKSTKAMTHLGGYDFSRADFIAAQQKTGHWDQRGARAQKQGLA